MTKTTTVRVDDSTHADIERVKQEIGVRTWAAAHAYLIKRGLRAHDADTKRGAK